MQRGPSNYEVVEVLDGGRSAQSHGVYETLAEAQGCVAFDRLREFEIWHGDHIVAECSPRTLESDIAEDR